MTLLLVIVLLLLALGALGVVVKGLLWLTLIAIVLIAGTIAYGWWRLRRAEGV